MDSAVHAMIMAFSVLIFVIGLTVAMNMLSQVNTTAEAFLYYADRTNFYDNIELEEVDADGNPISITNRKVDFDTIIPTLYRYYKENFCVKIYDADNTLIQIFDVNLEGEVRQAAAVASPTKKQESLIEMYNKNSKPQYLFEAPWIGSTDENIKTRIDYFVNGKAGYINNTYVNYAYNKFYNAREYNARLENAGTLDDKVYFREEFISYTFSGETITNDEGEVLVEGEKPKDKIIIVYTATQKIPDEI